MFAVIKTGGKQYRVQPDDVLRVERIEGDEGSRVEFGQVLMLGEGGDVTVGTPAVDGARVTAEVVEQGRGKKTISFKKRRRQNSRRKKGHRQYLTTVAILEVLKAGAEPSRDASGKSYETRRAEAAAERAAAAGDAAREDAARAGSKGKARSAKGASEGEAQGTADDAGLIEGSADPKPAGDAGATPAGDADVKPAAPKKGAAGKAAAKASVPSEDDEAADREAEMAEEAKAAGKAAGSTEGAASDAPAGDAPAGEPLFQAPEGEPDKLTKIKGIGPVAERQLNEQGITTYAQIAALSDDDVERIDANMPFSAAQIRTWREQAEELK